MDFTQLKAADISDQGAKLELRGPDGATLLKADGSAVTITLLGSDSDTYIKASNRQTNAALRKGFRPGTVTAESALSDRISLLVQVTVSWDGVGLGEEASPCTEENVRRLYTELPFVREQVEQFVTDRGNFVKALPKT